MYFICNIASYWRLNYFILSIWRCKQPLILYSVLCYLSQISSVKVDNNLLSTLTEERLVLIIKTNNLLLLRLVWDLKDLCLYNFAVWQIMTLVSSMELTEVLNWRQLGRLMPHTNWTCFAMSGLMRWKSMTKRKDLDYM